MISKAERSFLGLWAAIIVAYFVVFAWFACQMAGAQSTGQTPPAAPCTQPASTQPVFKINPPPGAIIENLDLKCVPPGTQQAGAGFNGSVNGTIRYCRIDGFNMGVMCTGYNPNLHVCYNVLVNSVPDPPSWKSSGSDDAHGAYIEGGDGVEFDHNIILDCGWWPTADFNDPNCRGTLSRHHGGYFNESHGTSDSKKIHDNIILNCAGSQIGCRLGGDVYDNVFESGFDWDVVLGGLGQFNPSTTPFGRWARLFGNLSFGPIQNVNPYYGGGFNLICPGVNTGNAGMSAATISPHALAIDASGNVIQQFGVWGTGGAVAPAPGAKIWTLADYYGTANFYHLMKCDDAPKIIAWYQAKLSTPAIPWAPAPLIVPATQPFDKTLHVDPMSGTVTVK